MEHKKPSPESSPAPEKTREKAPVPSKLKAKEESGGPSGPEPTRYGDWERGGKCVDF